jgi:malonyl-CoA O-methyltransferase
MPNVYSKSAVASAYDEWAETYDTVANPTRDVAAQALKESGLDFDSRIIIEVGCGTGRNTEWLAARAKEILALDFSEEMLARARVRVNDPRVIFQQHDLRNPWPIEDSAADVIVAMLVLEHIKQLAPFFAEAARTLKSEGQLFICELHPERQLMGKQARFINSRTGKQTLVPAFLHLTDEYLKAADTAGFTPLRVKDHCDAETQADEPPRLLSLLLRR